LLYAFRDKEKVVGVSCAFSCAAITSIWIIRNRFGHGFDALPGQAKANGWETHFIIGQQF
jgi:hypothetical protein